MIFLIFLNYVYLLFIRYTTVKTLLQYYLFFPFKHKECYLTYLLNEIGGQSCIVFTSTCQSTQKLTLMLRNLGFHAICLHGQMSQSSRLGALAKFKSGGRDILIATDVASRYSEIFLFFSIIFNWFHFS